MFIAVDEVDFGFSGNIETSRGIGRGSMQLSVKILNLPKMRHRRFSTSFRARLTKNP